MHNFRTRIYFLLPCLIALSVATAPGQTPAPAIMTQFSLPLADKTTAAATLLPTQNEQAWLVYATGNGKIGIWTLAPTSPSPNPIPPIPPEPIPPVPPVPPIPIPQKLTIAIVENPTKTTPEQRAVLANPTWRKLSTEKHDFRGIIPTDVIEKGTGKPPTSLVPFLDRAKLHNLPWCMFTTADGRILWEGQLPTSAKELAALIQRYGG